LGERAAAFLAQLRLWVPGLLIGYQGDLSNANLSGLNLSGANLSSANLRHANLNKTSLRGATLVAADLTNASMRDANVSMRETVRTDLSRAVLRGADLTGVDLSRLTFVRLDGADLRGAILPTGSRLTGLDLTTVQIDRASVIEAVGTFDVIRVSRNPLSAQFFTLMSVVAGQHPDADWISARFTAARRQVPYVGDSPAESLRLSMSVRIVDHSDIEIRLDSIDGVHVIGHRSHHYAATDIPVDELAFGARRLEFIDATPMPDNTPPATETGPLAEGELVLRATTLHDLARHAATEVWTSVFAFMNQEWAGLRSGSLHMELGSDEFKSVGLLGADGRTHGVAWAVLRQSRTRMLFMPTEWQLGGVFGDSTRPAIELWLQHLLLLETPETQSLPSQVRFPHERLAEIIAQAVVWVPAGPRLVLNADFLLALATYGRPWVKSPMGGILSPSTVHSGLYRSIITAFSNLVWYRESPFPDLALQYQGPIPAEVFPPSVADALRAAGLTELDLTGLELPPPTTSGAPVGDPWRLREAAMASEFGPSIPVLDSEVWGGDVEARRGGLAESLPGRDFAPEHAGSVPVLESLRAFEVTGIPLDHVVFGPQPEPDPVLVSKVALLLDRILPEGAGWGSPPVASPGVRSVLMVTPHGDVVGVAWAAPVGVGWEPRVYGDPAVPGLDQALWEALAARVDLVDEYARRIFNGARLADRRLADVLERVVVYPVLPVTGDLILRVARLVESWWAGASGATSQVGTAAEWVASVVASASDLLGGDNGQLPGLILEYRGAFAADLLPTRAGSSRSGSDRVELGGIQVPWHAGVGEADDPWRLGVAALLASPIDAPTTPGTLLDFLARHDLPTPDNLVRHVSPNRPDDPPSGDNRAAPKPVTPAPVAQTSEADAPTNQGPQTAEHRRLAEITDAKSGWRLWGPYVSGRQWGTVREDYSADGDAWEFFPFEQAHARAYRWGEDGIAAISDASGFVNLSVALWNGKDPILKERLYGLTNDQGNRGEDAKEYWWSVDGTPSHSWMQTTYRYPQAEYPYQSLRDENARRGRNDREFELADTGVLDQDRFFDVTVTHAKAGVDDICVTFTATNHGPDAAPLHLLPQMWLRNTWVWDSEEPHGSMHLTHTQVAGVSEQTVVQVDHDQLGTYYVVADGAPEVLFCDNETNAVLLFGSEANQTPYPKDGVNRRVVHDDAAAVNPERVGTKAALWYSFDAVPAGESVTVRVRMSREAPKPVLAGSDFDAVLADRQREADEFYAQIIRPEVTDEDRMIARRAYAGLLGVKQLFNYDVQQWLSGDSASTPPESRQAAGRRNTAWQSHFRLADVISMPDEWEYPWFAAWDLAFHAIPLAQVDPAFAKHQILLMCDPRAMHPNGQLPAYEWEFGDVNPPVHAWAAWNVYQIDGANDRGFLVQIFNKLMLNFSWWVNRKDPLGSNLFEGGFLGMDNIGLFNRSEPLPPGYRQQQADATAWMAFYALNMFKMALELARTEPSYGDAAVTYLDHFLAISWAMNRSLWHAEDGFYYDVLVNPDGTSKHLRVPSMVGMLSMIGGADVPSWMAEIVPDVISRLRWLAQERPELVNSVAMSDGPGQPQTLLSLLDGDRLRKVLARMFDPQQFLSEHGIRSMSAAMRDGFSTEVFGQNAFIQYEPGESQTGLFGGNSNWRGPVWIPVNVLLVEQLRAYGHYFGDSFTVEIPTGSNNHRNLTQAAEFVEDGLIGLFRLGAGSRPSDGSRMEASNNPRWREHVSFYEFFDGDTGEGLGASHQTGWTAYVATFINPPARVAQQPGPLATPAVGVDRVDDAQGRLPARPDTTPEPGVFAGELSHRASETTVTLSREYFTHPEGSPLPVDQLLATYPGLTNEHVAAWEAMRQVRVYWAELTEVECATAEDGVAEALEMVERMYRRHPELREVELGGYVYQRDNGSWGVSLPFIGSAREVSALWLAESPADVTSQVFWHSHSTVLTRDGYVAGLSGDDLISALWGGYANYSYHHGVPSRVRPHERWWSLPVETRQRVVRLATRLLAQITAAATAERRQVPLGRFTRLVTPYVDVDTYQPLGIVGLGGRAVQRVSVGVWSDQQVFDVLPEDRRPRGPLAPGRQPWLSPSRRLADAARTDRLDRPTILISDEVVTRLGGPGAASAAIRDVLAETPGTRVVFRGLIAGLDLSDLDLRGAYFGNARLVRVDLSGSRLDNAWFSGARLIQVRLDHARLSWNALIAAEFADIDILGHLNPSVAIGLEVRRTLQSAVGLESGAYGYLRTVWQVSGGADSPRLEIQLFLRGTTLSPLVLMPDQQLQALSPTSFSVLATSIGVPAEQLVLADAEFVAALPADAPGAERAWLDIAAAADPTVLTQPDQAVLHPVYIDPTLLAADLVEVTAHNAAASDRAALPDLPLPDPKLPGSSVDHYDAQESTAGLAESVGDGGASPNVTSGGSLWTPESDGLVAVTLMNEPFDPARKVPAGQADQDIVMALVDFFTRRLDSLTAPMVWAHVHSLTAAGQVVVVLLDESTRLHGFVGGVGTVKGVGLAESTDDLRRQWVLKVWLGDSIGVLVTGPTEWMSAQLAAAVEARAPGATVLAQYGDTLRLVKRLFSNLGLVSHSWTIVLDRDLIDFIESFGPERFFRLLSRDEPGGVPQLISDIRLLLPHELQQTFDGSWQNLDLKGNGTVTPIPSGRANDAGWKYQKLTKSGLSAGRSLMLVLQGITREQATTLSAVNGMGIELLSPLFTGVDFRKLRFKPGDLNDGLDFESVDLSDANLAGMRLQRRTFLRAVARRTNFQGANLTDASFIYADLAGADFSNANLANAEMLGAKLEGAVFRDANLLGAKLGGADYRKALLHGARVTCDALRWARIGPGVGRARIDMTELCAELAPLGDRFLTPTDRWLGRRLESLTNVLLYLH
ncbi:MAG: pentapeptide repeat-containing protein, partial [Nocardioides sp.]